MAKGKISNQENLLKNNYFSSKRFLSYIEQNPHRVLMIIAIIAGLIFRLIATLAAKGIIVPDEIYQGYEMAHLLVYDSGRIPSEFLDENPNTPSYAASRSWIFPLILSLFMRFGELIGLDYHNGTLPFIRIILAINSTMLIPASSKLAYQLTKNKNVSVVVAFNIALYWRIVEYTVRPLTNTFFLPYFFYGIYRILLCLERQEKISIYDQFIVICFVGISTYVRLDLLVVLFSMFVATFSMKHIKKYIVLIIDGIVAWLIAAQIDYHYYNSFFTVPLNWFKFNVIENKSDWFGLDPPSFYYSELIQKDQLIIWVLISPILISLILLVDKSEYYKSLNEDFNKLENGFIKIVISASITWLVFTSFWRGINFTNLRRLILYQESWNPDTHKEIRFILPGIVLLIILISTSMVILSQLVVNTMLFKRYGANEIKYSYNVKFKYWGNISLVLFLILIFTVHTLSIASSRWHLEQYDDSNEALIYIGHQSDLTGIIAVYPWFVLGGYTYLHRGADIKIEAVNLNFEEPEIVERNKHTIFLLIRDWEAGNYLILPRSEVQFYPVIRDVLREHDWDIDTLIDGRTEIWKRIF